MSAVHVYGSSTKITRIHYWIYLHFIVLLSNSQTQCFHSKPDGVYLLSVNEFRTSKTCNGCLCELTNMSVKEAIVHAEDGTLGVRRKRIHKVLHCKNSDGGNRNRCGNSWDRDVNASKNLLMLTMCHVLGYERPPAFTRTWRQHVRHENYVSGSAINIDAIGSLRLRRLA